MWCFRTLFKAIAPLGITFYFELFSIYSLAMSDEDGRTAELESKIGF